MDVYKLKEKLKQEADALISIVKNKTQPPFGSEKMRWSIAVDLGAAIEFIKIARMIEESMEEEEK